jgi:hypothetical protein
MDSWHFIFTGAPGTDVMPTQHDKRSADDVFVSQTLTYKETPQLLVKNQSQNDTSIKRIIRFGLDNLIIKTWKNWMKFLFNIV